MWSMEDTLLLIDDIRSYTCLWDVSTMDFKNRKVKNEAFVALANRYAVSPSEVEKKILSLKSQFRREHRKQSKRQHNGSASERKLFGSVYWFGYKPLLFLLNGMDDEQHEMNRSENVSLNGSEVKIKNEDEYELIEQNSLLEECESEPEYNRDVQSPPEKRQKLHTTAIEDRSIDCMNKLFDMLAKRDEFSVYGEHVANKLRNCNKNHFEISIAQHHMDNILFKLLMGGYKQGDPNMVSNMTNN